MTQEKNSSAGLASAWELLLGDYRADVGGFIERQQLDVLFRALAADGVAATEAFALDAAYDFLTSLLGGRDVVLVMPSQDEIARPRRLRITPPGAIAETLPARRFAPIQSPLVARHRAPPPASAPVSARATTPPMAERTPYRPPSVTADLPPEPPRPLFGRYLLAEGYITLSELTAAILWQRAQRPPVGQIAVDWRILTREQVGQILRHKSTSEMFCDHAVRIGLMSSFQRLAVLAKQRRLQRPIGAYFVERGILTQAQVDALARRVG